MLEKLLLVIITIAPALWLLRYYYRQDNAKPEPKHLIIQVFLWGCFLVIPAIILELLMTTVFSVTTGNFLVFQIAVKSFLVAGLVEEWLKRYTVKKVAYGTNYFDEVMDGIVYAVVASLGFATIENFFYVFEGGFTTGVIRAFTALPLHAITAGIMGYYIGLAKFADTSLREVQLFRKGLFKAVIIHGFYDFIVYSGDLISSIFFIALPFIIIFGFLYLRKLIKMAVWEDKMMGRHDDFVSQVILH
jgi:RsiW-degrading membrane proteinase PrsW (M82 family)